LGVYTVGNSVFDLWVALILGVLAFAMKQVGFGITPLIIGFVLGSNIERSFRQALVILNGNFLSIFARPISAVFLVLALLVVLTQMIVYFYKGRVIEIPSDE
jgi:putative tricarboxylic transport membrane protein